MKTYTVIRAHSGEVGCVVSNGSGTATVLRHCAYHSPTGFETGYAGAGPADLALSILADHFDADPDQVRHVAVNGFGGHSLNAEKAMLYHQCVKFRFVAPSDRALKPGEQYTITSREIDDYIADLLAGSKAGAGRTGSGEAA